MLLEIKNKRHMRHSGISLYLPFAKMLVANLHTWRHMRMAELDREHLAWNEAKGKLHKVGLGGAL